MALAGCRAGRWCRALCPQRHQHDAEKKKSRFEYSYSRLQSSRVRCIGLNLAPGATMQDRATL